VLWVLVLVLGVSTMIHADDFRERDSVRAPQGVERGVGVDEWIDRELPSLLEVYRHLHASTVRTKDRTGVVVGVMHACGHSRSKSKRGHGTALDPFQSIRPGITEDDSNGPTLHGSASAQPF